MQGDYTASIMDEIVRSYAATEVPAEATAMTYAPHSSRPVSAEPEFSGSVDHGERLTTLLEANTASLRRNMMDFYRDMRSAYLSAQRQAIDAERRSAAVQIHSKKEETEVVQGALAVAQNRVEDQDLALEKACNLVAFYAARSHEWHLLISYFKLWLRNVKAIKRAERLERTAETWHQDWLKRHTIRSWWFNAGRSMRARVKGHMDAAAQRAAAKVAEEKDAELTTVRAQLLEVRRAHAAEKEARESLAQDMKRSFMRGVCALNMEAMQVMKHNSDPNLALPSSGALRAAHANGHDMSDPEPEAIPASIQNMMSSLNITPGVSCPAPKVPMHAVATSGCALSGFAVQETRSPVPPPRPGVKAMSSQACK